MPRTETKTNIQKKAMLKALVKTLGIVAPAAKLTHLELKKTLKSKAPAAETIRLAHYTWLKSDEDYKENVESMDNIALDFAESHLHKQIEGDIPSSTIFYLKTKGKSRGYIERTEVTGEDGGNLNLTIVTKTKKAKEAVQKFMEKP